MGARPPDRLPPPSSSQLAALLTYILCGLFSSSFVANFVAVVVLLMADFWTVGEGGAGREGRGGRRGGRRARARAHPSTHSPPLLQTKNVAGRLLVGLRWWNEVADGGGSNWRFESLSETAGRAVNPRDAAAFWWLLYGVPPVWLLLGLVALFRLKLDYLLVVAIAVTLGGANAAGYTKASKAASAAVSGYASSAMSAALRSGLSAAMGRV